MIDQQHIYLVTYMENGKETSTATQDFSQIEFLLQELTSEITIKTVELITQRQGKMIPPGCSPMKDVLEDAEYRKTEAETRARYAYDQYLEREIQQCPTNPGVETTPAHKEMIGQKIVVKGFDETVIPKKNPELDRLFADSWDVEE